MLDTWGVYPPRNLPEPTAQWCRVVESRLGHVRRALNGSDQMLSGTNRGNAAITADLARRIHKLDQAAEDLQNALNDVPVTLHRTVRESSFAVPSNWGNLVTTTLNVPEGKTSAEILVVGNCRLYRYEKGSGGGGGGPIGLSWPFRPSPAPGGDMPPVGSSDEPLAEYGPRNLTGAFHEGMDFGYGNATAGAYIPAAGAGTVHVNQAGFMGYGNTMIINHGTDSAGNTIYTLYAHRTAVSGPPVGSSITQGGFVGYVGSSGNVFGPHLHFEVHVVPPGGSLTWDYQNPSYNSNRTAVNPREYIDEGSIGGGGEPTGTYSRIDTRVSIAGSTSSQFRTIGFDTYGYSYPLWSRTTSVTPGGTVSIGIQGTANGGEPDSWSGAYAEFTVIGSFS